jgi:hypothetical protein
MQDCDGYGGSEFGRVGDDILFVVYAVRGDADHLISARLARLHFPDFGGKIA